jgi:hypothetical protein
MFGFVMSNLFLGIMNSLLEIQLRIDSLIATRLEKNLSAMRVGYKVKLQRLKNNW